MEFEQLLKQMPNHSEMDIVLNLPNQGWHVVERADARYYVNSKNQDVKVVLHTNNLICWYRDGGLHRTDGPAMIKPNPKNVEWWQNGKKHRVGGPAVIYEDGVEQWFLEGVRHRTDGPAYIVPNKYEGWYYLGNLHRVHGPAEIFDNGLEKHWWFQGERHRTPGPAIERANGNSSYWNYGECYDLFDFNRI